MVLVLFSPNIDRACREILREYPTTAPFNFFIFFSWRKERLKSWSYPSSRFSLVGTDLTFATSLFSKKKKKINHQKKPPLLSPLLGLNFPPCPFILPPPSRLFVSRWFLHDRPRPTLCRKVSGVFATVTCVERRWVTGHGESHVVCQ